MFNPLQDLWVVTGGTARTLREKPPGEVLRVVAYNPRLPLLVYLGRALPEARAVLGLCGGTTDWPQKSQAYVDDTDPGGPLIVYYDG